MDRLTVLTDHPFIFRALDDSTAMLQLAGPSNVHPTTPVQTPEIIIICALEASKR